MSSRAQRARVVVRIPALPPVASLSADPNDVSQDPTDAAIDARLAERVIEIFDRNVPGAAARGLSLDTRIKDELGLPSITVVAILFDLQDAFGVDLMGIEVQLGALQTVRDVAALVAKHPA
jgi:acyl carrier protein